MIRTATATKPPDTRQYSAKCSCDKPVVFRCNRNGKWIKYNADGTTHGCAYTAPGARRRAWHTPKRKGNRTQHIKSLGAYAKNIGRYTTIVHPPDPKDYGLA